MEFLTPKQKKEKVRRLFIGYGLLSILILLASYILISTALGYEVFHAKGEVIQNGLLFVDSKPDGADIFINGKKESSATNTKLSLQEGKYDVSLKKSGYQEWRGKVSLSGGSVKFVVYPKLLPVKPDTLVDIPFQSGQLTIKQSINKRWLAVTTADISKPVEIYDQDNPNSPPISLAVPANIVGEKKLSSVELLEWSHDDRHLLVRVAIDEIPVVLLFDRESAQTVIDLTQSFTLLPTDRVGFWDEKWDKIYIQHASGAVQLADIKARTVDQSFITPDLALDFYPMSGSRAVYTVAAGDNDLAIKLYSDSKSYVFSTLKKSQSPLEIKIAKFNRNEYVLISGGSLEKTLLYRNIENSVKKATQRIAPYAILPIRPSFADFSPQSRFVLAYDGTINTIYDIESKEVIRYPNPVPDSVLVGWFDSARIFSVSADKTLSIFDFDSANLYKLANNIVGVPYANEDSSRASFVVPSANLQYLRMIDIETPTTK